MKKNRIFPRIVSFLLVSTLTLNNISFANAAQLTTQQGGEFAEALAEWSKVEKRLNSLGVSLSDFENVPLLDDDFCNEINEYYENNPITPSSNNIDTRFQTRNVGSTEEIEFDDSVDLFAQRFAYSAYISEVNNRRDRNKTTADMENIYMYLSHYVDMAPNHVGSSLSYNSNDGFFSAWITNQDRQVYDDYLRFVLTAEQLEDFRSMATSTISGVANAVNMSNDFASLRDGGQRAVQDIHTTASFLINGDSSVSDFQNVFSTVISELETREHGMSAYDVIEKVEENRAFEDYSSDLKSGAITIAMFIAGALLSISISGGIVAFIPLICNAVNLLSKFNKDFFDHVKWTAMIGTSRGRSSERFMRYIYGY